MPNRAKKIAAGILLLALPAGAKALPNLLGMNKLKVPATEEKAFLGSSGTLRNFFSLRQPKQEGEMKDSTFQQIFDSMCKTIADSSASSQDKISACGLAYNVITGNGPYPDLNNSQSVEFGKALAAGLGQISSNPHADEPLSDALLKIAGTFASTYVLVYGNGLRVNPGVRLDIAAQMLTMFENGYVTKDGVYPLAILAAFMTYPYDSNNPQLDMPDSSGRAFLAKAIKTISENLGNPGYLEDAAANFLIKASNYVSDQFTAETMSYAMSIYSSFGRREFSQFTLDGLENYMDLANQGGFLSQSVSQKTVDTLFSKILQNCQFDGLSPRFGGQSFCRIAKMCGSMITDSIVNNYIAKFNQEPDDDFGGMVLGLCMANPSQFDRQEVRKWAYIGRETAELLLKNGWQYYYKSQEEGKFARGWYDFRAIRSLAYAHSEDYIATLASPPFNIGYFGQYPDNILQSQYDFYKNPNSQPSQYLFMQFTKTPMGSFGQALDEIANNPNKQHYFTDVQMIILEPDKDTSFVDAALFLQQKFPSKFPPLTILNDHGLRKGVRFGYEASEPNFYYLDTGDTSLVKKFHDGFSNCANTSHMEAIINACSTADTTVKPIESNFAHFLANSWNAKVYAAVTTSTDMHAFGLYPRPDGSFGFVNVDLGNKTIIDGTMQTGIESSVPYSYSANVYPNPVSGIATFEVPPSYGEYRIDIYDAAGRAVLRVPGHQGTLPIDISRLSDGAYIYAISPYGKQEHGATGILIKSH